MSGAFGKYTVLISLGIEMLCFALFLYFFLNSKNKSYYRYYYKGFLLILVAGLSDPLLQIWFRHTIPAIQVMKAIWVLLFGIWGFLLFIQGYKRSKLERNSKGSALDAR